MRENESITKPKTFLKKFPEKKTPKKFPKKKSS